MDVLIFLMSLYGLIGQKKLYLAVTGQIILATGYLGMSFSLKNLVFFNESFLIFSIIIFILFFFKFNYKKQFSRKNVLTKNVLFLYLFLIVSILFDLSSSVSFYDILSNVKLWFFLSAIWVYPCIPSYQFLKIIKILLYFTVFIAVLGILDFLFGTMYLSEIIVNNEGIKRAIIPSTYTLFFIIALLTNLLNIKKKIKIIFLIILISIILLSVIRSLILGVVLSFILIILIDKTYNFSKIKKIIIFIIPLCLLIFLNKDINSRFQDFSSKEDTTTNTSILTANVFLERFNYIVSSPKTFILGVGNIREENAPILFSFGNSSRDDGNTDQLYSPDISWPNLLIRLGFVGTIIYLIFYFKIMSITYKRRNFNKFYKALFVYMFISITIISFASSIISLGSFWLLPLLLYSYSNKDPQQDMKPLLQKQS